LPLRVYNNDPMTRDRIDPRIGIALGGLLPLVLASLLVPFRDDVANTNIALALVVPVVLAATAGGWRAGAFGAVVATLTFDFFFTKPYLSLTIDSQDDIETCALLLVVGLVVGALAGREHRQRSSARAGRDEIARLHRLAELVAGGAGTDDVIRAAETEISELLHLRACRFERPPYSGALPWLERSGALRLQPVQRLARGGFELPAGGVGIPVMRRGRQVGRFVLIPSPETGTSLEARVVAVALTDQVGGALDVAPDSGESPDTDVSPDAGAGSKR